MNFKIEISLIEYCCFCKIQKVVFYNLYIYVFACMLEQNKSHKLQLLI